MAAGVAVLTQILTRDAYPALHAMADRLTAGCQAGASTSSACPATRSTSGPKGCVMFTPARVTNYRDFIGLDSELWAASFFYLANRGVLLPPGPDDQWTLSVAAHRRGGRPLHLDLPRLRPGGGWLAGAGT